MLFKEININQLTPLRKLESTSSKILLNRFKLFFAHKLLGYPGLIVYKYFYVSVTIIVILAMVMKTSEKPHKDLFNFMMLQNISSILKTACFIV